MKPMWKEGQFIMPQHFQLMDNYHEELLDQRVSALREFSWGVAELEVDLGELSRGLFTVTRCIAVMPDGLLVEVDEDRPLQVVAKTSGGLVGGGHELDVYLAVPGTDSRGTASYAGDGSAAGTRYVQSVRSSPDDYGSTTDAQVEVLHPNAQLLLGHDNRQNYVTIKLAQLELEQTGNLRMSDSYMPPCLKIRSADALMERLKRLLSRIGAKQRTLAERYGGRVGALVEFGVADMSTFWEMHTLNSWLPMLQHFNEAGHVHPEQLYVVLCSLASQLSAFEVGKTPDDLPKFRYLDLEQTFVPLFDLLNRLLQVTTEARYETIPLDQRQPGLFVGDVSGNPQLLRTKGLYLIARGDVPPNTLRQDVPNYLKIGSLDNIAHIVSIMGKGVEFQVDMAPPPAIPIHSDALYLQLDRQGQIWDSVLHSQTVAIYQPVNPDRISLELVAILEAKR